ncbi:DUF6524 family protein [Rhodovulum steppense]|uniref:Uncharacterized protein n=1 Tax=Rhodovulum steppense TaxID=540251 RepID=A0A4R1YVL2_9RHOB|nr:DUF6524 family protein [Rhodovulum steppense]TCM84957.1 hypothetical protein EV216_10942 [Rhodovulum steppense]
MSGFLLRWAIAAILLAAAYNPTQYNYTTWAQANFEGDQRALVIGLGAMLAIAFLVYLIGTLRALGVVGLFLVVIIFGLLGYILIDKGIIEPVISATNIWGGIAVLSLILAAAMSWRRGTKAPAKKSTPAKKPETKTAQA